MEEERDSPFAWRVLKGKVHAIPRKNTAGVKNATDPLIQENGSLSIGKCGPRRGSTSEHSTLKSESRGPSISDHFSTDFSCCSTFIWIFYMDHF